MKDFGTLKLLCETAGVTGNERRIAEVVKNQFTKYCDSVVVDEFNNVVGIMKANDTTSNSKGKCYRLMFVSHIDEIGMMVKKVEKGGFVRVSKISGVDPKTLLSTKVVIHSSSGEIIKGVIGATPPHLIKKEDKNKTPKFDDIYIDTGLSDEALEKAVQIGDSVTYDTTLEMINKNVVTGKALDNRCSIMTLIKTMQELKGITYQNDLIFVASVGEEFNSLGATIAVTNLEPDLAVAIDVTHGKAGSDDDGDEKTFVCGKGPVVLYSPILNRKITQKFNDICKANGFTNEVEVDNRDTGTDAFALTVGGTGTPCAVLSIPLKYMHTQAEMLDFRDIIYTSDTLIDFIMLDSNVLGDLLCY